jgi:cellobiose phosphorylase
VTGVTGKGYVWTAARSLRAVLLGLAGIRLTAAGLVVTPRLPAGWGPVRLLGVPFRGSTYDIVVQHAPRPALLVDGTPLPWATPIRPTAAPGHHVVSVSV